MQTIVSVQSQVSESLDGQFTETVVTNSAGGSDNQMSSQSIQNNPKCVEVSFEYTQ